MAKKIFVVFNCIFLCLILFAVGRGEDYQLEENTDEQAEVVTNVKNSAFLKNKLKMLERIFSQQRKDYLELNDRIEDIQKENSSLKEELAVLDKEISLLEREKAILELMANRRARDLKRPPLVKIDDDLDKAIYINLGYAYSLKGKIRDAIEEYRLALKCDPEDKDIHYNLGYLLAKEDRCKDAIEEYKKALKGESSDREIYYNLAIIYSTCLKDKKMSDYCYEKFLSIPSVNKSPAP